MPDTLGHHASRDAGDGTRPGAALLAEAKAIADDHLFPSAGAVEALPILPRAHLDPLAASGWYGFMVPAEHGGLGLDRDDALTAIELFAGGCLTTTLVWIQHIAGVMSACFGPEHIRDEWFEPLRSGACRAGIAFGGLIPGPPVLRATRSAGGWTLDGSSPWVSGWGHVDMIVAAARTTDDQVVNVFVDAAESPTLTAVPHRLFAANASATVSLTFGHHFVPDHRVTGIQPFAGHAERDAANLGLNGSLALGIAERALELMGPSALDEELVLVRRQRAMATPATLPAARAAIASFAVRAASALMVDRGSSGVIAGNDAERLAREATFLLVFATRPTIKARLLDILGTDGVVA